MNFDRTQQCLGKILCRVYTYMSCAIASSESLQVLFIRTHLLHVHVQKKYQTQHTHIKQNTTLSINPNETKGIEIDQNIFKMLYSYFSILHTLKRNLENILLLVIHTHGTYIFIISRTNRPEKYFEHMITTPPPFSNPKQVVG